MVAKVTRRTFIAGIGATIITVESASPESNNSKISIKLDNGIEYNISSETCRLYPKLVDHILARIESGTIISDVEHAQVADRTENIEVVFREGDSLIIPELQLLTHLASTSSSQAVGYSSIHFSARNSSNAKLAAKQANGTIIEMGGYLYKVDHSAKGRKSCVFDLEQDGLVPFSQAHPEHFGAVGIQKDDKGGLHIETVGPDDSIALQHALDSGKSILLTAGKVYLSSSRLFFGSFTELRGNNQWSSGICFVNPKNNGFIARNSPIRVLFQDIEIYRGNSPDWKNKDIGIDATSVSYSRFRRIRIHRFHTAIMITRDEDRNPCWFNSFHDIEGYLCAYAIDVRMSTSYVNCCDFSSIHAKDVGGFSGGAALSLSGYGHSVFRVYSGISRGSSGILLQPITGNCVIYQPYIESNPLFTIDNRALYPRINKVIMPHSDGSELKIDDPNSTLIVENYNKSSFPIDIEVGSKSRGNRLSIYGGETEPALEIISKEGKNAVFSIVGTKPSDSIVYSLSTGVDLGSHYSQDSLRIDKNGIHLWDLLDKNGNFAPAKSGLGSIGSPEKRVHQLFSNVAENVLSDGSKKFEIDKIDGSLLTAWEEVELLQYKIKDAGKENSKNTIHYGMIAQQIRDTLIKKGIDPKNIAFINTHSINEGGGKVVGLHDEGSEDKMESGDISIKKEEMSLIYTEMLIIESALTRKRLKEIDEKVENIKAQMSELIRVRPASPT